MVFTKEDLGVKMVIVADNDKIIFLNANDTDNITDGSVHGTMIDEVQTICDNTNW